MRPSRRKQRAVRAAERLYRRVATIAAEIDLPLDDVDVGIDELAWQVYRDLRPRWIGYGTTRLVVPIGPDLVFKTGFEQPVRDEQERWALARGDRASRRWMLPVLLQRPGAWSVLPTARPMRPGEADLVDRLEGRAVREARALRGVEADLGAENWGWWRGRPVVIDYGGVGESSLRATVAEGLLNAKARAGASRLRSERPQGRRLDGGANEDPFGGWSIRVATDADPAGGRLGTGPWVAEKDGDVVHRFSSPSTAWRFVRETVHRGGRRPWRGRRDRFGEAPTRHSSGGGDDDGRANDGAPPCRIVAVDEDSDDVHLGDTSLFGRVGINVASYEEPLLACVTPDDEVLGLVVAGYTQPWEDGPGEYRFSVAVDPDVQRRGVGRMLVRALKDWFEAEQGDLQQAHGTWIQLVAWVVDPRMAALLESEGFDSDGDEWSPDSPYMRMD